MLSVRDFWRTVEIIDADVTARPPPIAEAPEADSDMSCYGISRPLNETRLAHVAPPADAAEPVEKLIAIAHRFRVAIDGNGDRLRGIWA